MAMTVVDRAVVDTNVLVAATDESRRGHRRAVEVLDDWPTVGTVLYTSGQILREYLAVATRPLDMNGMGVSSEDAIANVRSLRGRLHLLAENTKVADHLLVLLAEVPCSGKQVHDANIVATMLVHGVGAIVTADEAHFARFAGMIDVVEAGA